MLQYIWDKKNESNIMRIGMREEMNQDKNKTQLNSTKLSIKADLMTIHLQHKWCRIDNLDYHEAHVQNMKRDNGKQQRNKEYKL